MRRSCIWAVWLSVGIAVSVGIVVTHSAACLWAFVIPAFITPFE